MPFAPRDLIEEAEHSKKVISKARGEGIAELLHMKREFERYMIKVSSIIPIFIKIVCRKLIGIHNLPRVKYPNHELFYLLLYSTESSQSELMSWQKA